ncbi:DUF3455 domain-containing protein [Actinoplanes aureus]|uniref:DUF3455 domain-containing protein n=1 Tax=Actinoplanes aureus TaxID=2792083 RepID=A0A931FWJ2_9ACTN|nr:DUF3455 domain-containing protein [Actinoplanes aureus]MBG0561405.1 DUF3455 domain-containing protein [Actinoplanes aureus]
MLSTTRSRIRAVAAVGMAAVATAAVTVTFETSAVAGAADSHAATAPLIPEIIQPPAGSRLVGAYLVTSGTQTYTCVVPAGATTGAYTGASVPEAQLIGTGGRVHHFAGPSWQSVRDGSLVTATRVESSPRAGTIPELLLKVASRSGEGVLSRADYINRLRTSGGVAPTGACTAGQTASVPYGSLYVFWDAPTA